MKKSELSAFSKWIYARLTQIPVLAGKGFDRSHLSIVDGCLELLDGGSGSVWDGLPALIQDAGKCHGWEWNGIYVKRDLSMQLRNAAGPPVCECLPLRGGMGDSGTCFDALLMNQSLIITSPTTWPGYVSCDHRSGIDTVASIVCPLRDSNSRPCAVWDLDSSHPVLATDLMFFDAVLSSLCVVSPFSDSAVSS